MADKTEYCFSKLVKENPIRIPKIQRDYAQGRKNDIATEIRDRFVHTLVSAIHYGHSLELDFIYGSDRDKAFEPLDGQQRLTTLYLLHWMLDCDLYDEKTDLSLLTYKTRETSSDFCQELVQHKASSLREEVHQKLQSRQAHIDECEANVHSAENLPRETPGYVDSLKKAKEILRRAKEVAKCKMSDIITNRDWFNYLWSYDPTIQSMLVMIDAIWEEFEDICGWNVDINRLRDNLDNITFSYLNLREFGLSDELFIKMNARGKQLSSYDFMKSSLEEEIQTQKSEGNCYDNTECNWRSLVDGKWIDWFWNMFAFKQLGEITADPDEYHKRLSLAKKSEENLKRLILRTIGIEFLRLNSVNESVNEKLIVLSYNDQASNLDKIIPAYQDSLKRIRNSGEKPEKNQTIDFEAIMTDINSLFYQGEDGIYHSIFDLIPKESNINCDHPEVSSLSYMLDDKFPNDCKVIFYAGLRYLISFPNVTTKGIPSKNWTENFIYWMTVCRNIFINDNNNVRIDTCEKLLYAFKAVNLLVAEIEDFRKQIDDMSVREFFKSLKGKNIVGIDNQSLEEETTKAVLRGQGSWNEAIMAAESDNYLWGQIRCLLNWAGDDENKFRNYREKLIAILSCEHKNELLAALITVSPEFGFSGTRFYVFNKERDNSVKRYLRDAGIKQTTGTYGPAYKSLIDLWTSEYNDKNIEEVVELIRTKGQDEDYSYRRCIVERPDILEEAWNKMIFRHNGHYVLAQRKTINSHCFDIALLYLWYQMRDYEKFGDITHYDSVGVSYQYALTFTFETSRYRIEQQKEGKYYLHISDKPDMTFENEKELLEYFEPLIKPYETQNLET